MSKFNMLDNMNTWYEEWASYEKIDKPLMQFILEKQLAWGKWVEYCEFCVEKCENKECGLMPRELK